MLTWEVKVPGMSTNLSMEVVLSIILTGLSLELSINDRLYTLYTYKLLRVELRNN